MHAHPFSQGDFADLLGLIADNAAARPVGHTYLMTSDVVWQFPGCEPETNIRLWRDEAGLAAFGWFQPPDTVLFDVRTDLEDTPLGGEVLSWAEDRRPRFPPGYPFHVDLKSMQEWAEAIEKPVPHRLSANRYLVASALGSDTGRQRLLEQRGFELSGHFEPVLTRSLDSIATPVTQQPFELRNVEESELDARVALHAAAWAPSRGFTLDRYREIRSLTEVFDPTLDIVAVAADGMLASCTIAWADPVSRIGSFEPFGTRPEYRGTGVSQAVLHEGFRRLADKGMTFARIYTAGFNQPAIRLYENCGFVHVDDNRTYLKRL